MGLKEAAIFASSTRGMANSLQNLRSIRESKNKQKQNDELFDINLKSAKLKLEALERTSEISSVQKELSESLLKKIQSDNRKISEGNNAQRGLLESTEMNKIKSFEDIAGQLAGDPSVHEMILGSSLTAGLPENKAKGIASNISPNLPQDDFMSQFERTGTLKDIATDPLSTFKFKETKKVFRDKGQGELEQLNEIPSNAIILKTPKGQSVSLPAGITDEQTAVKFLMKEQGLSEEEATQLVIDNR